MLWQRLWRKATVIKGSNSDSGESDRVCYDVPGRIDKKPSIRYWLTVAAALKAICKPTLQYARVVIE
jgi:hypothetical protein